MFRECGSSAFEILGLGLVAFFVAATAVGLAASRSRGALGVSIGALLLALLTSGGGLLGTLRGRSLVDQVLDGPAIDPLRREELRLQGYAEALQCTRLGGAMSAIPVVLGAVALGLSLRRPAPPRA